MRINNTTTLDNINASNIAASKLLFLLLVLFLLLNPPLFAADNTIPKEKITLIRHVGAPYSEEKVKDYLSRYKLIVHEYLSSKIRKDGDVIKECCTLLAALQRTPAPNTHRLRSIPMIHTHTIKKPLQKAVAVLQKVEGFRGYIYADGVGVPTIGYGVALVVSIGRNQWGVRGDLHTLFEGVYVLSDEDNDNLQAAATYLTNGTGSNPYTDEDYDPRWRITQEAGGTMLANLLPRYEAGLKNLLSADIWAQYQQSLEGVALLSLWYNGETRTIPQTGQLVQALHAGNRAKAWYEIRYNINSARQVPGIRKGIAKRRYYEAALFNLYDNGVSAANISAEDALEIYRLYTDHRAKILAYEQQFHAEIAKANKDYKLSAEEQVKTLKDSLAIAAEKLRTTYIDGDFDAAIDALDIQLAKETGDTLYSGAGDDILYHNTKDNAEDHSADTLKGGEGFDIYYAGNQDTIEDSDGILRYTPTKETNRIQYTKSNLHALYYI